MMKNFALKTILLMAVAAAPLIAKEEAMPIESMVALDTAPLDRSGKSGFVTSYAETLSAVTKAVVSVSSKQVVNAGPSASDPMWRFFERGRPQPREVEGIGSGVIVTENGYILTNNHVVEGATSVSIHLQDGTEYPATVVGTDKRTDIAVLKVDATGLPKITLADSDTIEVGDITFAIGNPLGVGQTVTMGIVSAKERKDLGMMRGGYENFIQTDASINQGNSGGALVDATGRLIGINTMILTDGRSSGNIGIGFAVPSNLAYFVLSNLVTSGSVTRGFLGVGIDRVTKDLAEIFGYENTKGALVTSVTVGSPADKIGLKDHDVIVAIDGKEVSSPSDLSLRIAGKAPGTEVKIEYIRGHQRHSAVAVLDNQSDHAALFGQVGPAGEILKGVKVEALSPELRERFEIQDEKVSGLVIVEVSPDSAYANRLEPGVVIEKINGQTVRSLADAAKLLKKGSKNALYIYYRGIFSFMAIEVE